MRFCSKSLLFVLCALLLLASSFAQEENNEEAPDVESECEEHHGGADVVLVLFFMLLIGLVARYALSGLPVPYTALLLILGMILGAMEIRLTRKDYGTGTVVHETTAHAADGHGTTSGEGHAMHLEGESNAHGGHAPAGEAHSGEHGTDGGADHGSGNEGVGGSVDDGQVTHLEDNEGTGVADSLGVSLRQVGDESEESGSEHSHENSEEHTVETSSDHAEQAGHGNGHGGEHGGHSGHIDVMGHDAWEKFAVGIDAWAGLEPELMLLLFLPALIFSSAFSLEFHITKKSFGQVLTLAGPGVVIGTCLTALFVKYAFPYEWCWPKCFMFGAMISATDPVAVVALLKEVGASKRLGTVIEGESLFNDGTAFVFFLLFRDMIPTNSDCLDDKNNCKGDTSEACATGVFVPQGCLTERSFGESIGFFLQLALGGPAIGIAFGLAATFWIQYIYNDLLTEISVTLVTAYLTFYVAEDVASVSGVLAVVALGLFMGSFAKDRVSSAVHEPMHVFWEMMEYLANTLIFVFTGLKIAVELFDSTNPNSEFIESGEWGYAILLYFVLQIIRFITIFSLLPVLKRMGYGMTWKDALVAVWGGLRGAVGLALALIVQLDDRHIPPSFRSYTIFYLGFVVIATLLVNGTTMPYLLKYLGVTKASPEKLEVLLHLLNEMEDSGERRAMHGEDDLLGTPDQAEIQRLTALNIAKIVPTYREIERVLERASVTHRPATYGIQDSLTRQSLAKLHRISRYSMGGFGGIKEEDEHAGDPQRVLEVGIVHRGFMQSLRDTFKFSKVESSKSGGGYPKEDFTPDMLVQDLRSRLLQGVKTAYAEWLEKGYINATAMFDLIASADYAIDRLDEPICDWKHIEKVAQPSRWRVELQKLRRPDRCRGPMGEVFMKSISKLLFDTMFYAVLITRTYIMAHTEAEHTLHEHIKSEMGGEERRTSESAKMRMLKDAVEMVLNESKDATRSAYEQMRNFRVVYPEVLRAIKTRLSAQEVLLEKQSYVHQIECAGLIENREAAVIRNMIDAKIKYLTYSTLMLEMPNSHDQLHHHCLFVSVPQNLFDSQVWPHAKPKVFTKGNTIHKIGDEPRHVTIVTRGLVKIMDASGNESPIGEGLGSVLGVPEIMLRRPRYTTAICETTCEVIQVDRQMFEVFIERFPSVKNRSWQLTGMMLTFLNPWGDFLNRSLLNLATVFRYSQLLEFESGHELRVRSRSYLVTGTVREAGFDDGTPRTIQAPSPLGPGMGIYHCITPVRILRIAEPEGPGHTTSISYGKTKNMLARTSTSLQRVSNQASVPSQPNAAPQASSSGGGLGGIPEDEATDGGKATVDKRSRADIRRASVDHAFSADLETRIQLTRRLNRTSIEF